LKIVIRYSLFVNDSAMRLLIIDQQWASSNV
jgi:hypothetical protein